MRVEELDRDLILFRGEAYDSGSLAILAGDRALLVDGLASVADARELRRILVEERGRRVALLVSTHFFSDHMAAWNLFPEAELLAHADAVATFRREEFRTAEEAAHFREPTRRLSGRLALTWGRFRLEVFESPGHTADALNVDVPEADLLHVGDAAVGRMAYLHYAEPDAMDRALERALARGRGRILRSHGPVAGPEALRSARGYLRLLAERAREARRAGTPLEEIAIADCLPPGEPATEFETFFHGRNLASIRARGLFSEASMILILFRSRLTDAAGEDYRATDARLEELARAAPGFVDVKAYTAADGERLTIVRWRDLESLRQWREDPRHREAQAMGREHWYEFYVSEVAELLRESRFARPAVGAVP